MFEVTVQKFPFEFIHPSSDTFIYRLFNLFGGFFRTAFHIYIAHHKCEEFVFLYGRSLIGLIEYLLEFSHVFILRLFKLGD